MKKILMVVGSLRKGSFNKQLAEHIVDLIGDKAEVSFLEYADIPLLNQDFEFPTPEPVARVRKEIEAADGVWLVSPEYNDNMPPVVKNMLDWISRAKDENNPEAGKTSAGVKITFSGIGGASGTAGCRDNLYGVCQYIGMDVIADKGTGVYYDQDTFATGLVTVSEEDNERLKEHIDTFIEAI